MHSRTHVKLGVLGCLYFVQGLPFGFQITALPVYLRQEGVSLSAIGWVGALSLPWMLKVLWAPLVDRWGSARLGRRRSWILPAQGILGLCCAAAAMRPESAGLGGLLILIFLMNLAAATQDIAVDGYAADVLAPDELGPGNAAQVVGYKLGMLTGGGLLLWVSQYIGWSGLFWTMASLVAGVWMVVFWMRESPMVEEREPPGTVGEVIRVTASSLWRRTGLWMLLVVGTYKTGESMVDVMFKPFLVDAGFSAGDIGLWVGTWGQAFSILGSLIGGWLAFRFSISRALLVVAALRVIPLVGIWALTLSPFGATAVIGVTCAENLFGGALTTVMFALMMRSVDRRVGATHFTALAALEVLGKSPGSWLSGVLAD
ncbi:MAG: MFS transporter, partial [Myxococcota bacterium]|nr:MFS transporter [Myxococcota bacterium]